MKDDEAWVEKRLAWISRVKALRPETVDVSIDESEPGGEGEINRHGMPCTPPGQHLVEGWPVLDMGHQPMVPLAEWRLEICGEVERPLVLDWDGLMALPQLDQEADFHCVTTWSRLNLMWRGVSFRALCEHVLPTESARYVITQGKDRDPGGGVPYTTNLSLERALAPDVMLAHHCEGAPLSVEHGGPVRMITPRLYAWKGAKWIERIEFAKEDRLGYWEERGYSNSAEPWYEDRFSGGEG